MEVGATSRKVTLLSLTFLWGLSGVLARTNLDVTQGQKLSLVAIYNSGGDLNSISVVWYFNNNVNSKAILSFTKGSLTVENSPLTGRIGFINSMPSQDVSMYINNTQESDSGNYNCFVLMPGKDTFQAEFSVNVKVPPAVPKCSLLGKPVLKGNVTLRCSSSTGKPVPVYRWIKTSPNQEVFFSPMLNEKNGTLKLSNLSSNMSGKYTCMASNAVGSESCFINLDIITSTNIGMIVGGTVGSLVGFIFLLLVCLFFLVKRRRDSEDDMANDIKEDAQAPKRVSWTRSSLGPDVISKNGTLSSIGSSPLHKEPSLHHHNNHQHLQQYQRPPSDTASIITATGSTAGYRASRHHGASTPTHYSYNNNTTLPHRQPISSQASIDGSTLPRPERYTQLPQAQAPPQTYSQPQLQLKAAPSPPPLPTSTVTASNIARMGGVPIMVPAQNQAGSLV